MRDLGRVSDRSVHSRTRSIVFTSAIFVLLSTTITFVVLYANKSCPSESRRRAAANGAIGFPPLVPQDGDYVQWTLLHLNDVYEMMPSDEGGKGGLARVTHARQLLLDEDRETYTILSGDFLSPSAMIQWKSIEWSANDLCVQSIGIRFGYVRQSRIRFNIRRTTFENERVELCLDRLQCERQRH